jgi:AraC-like DNA-binding protein
MRYGEAALSQRPVEVRIRLLRSVARPSRHHAGVASLLVTGLPALRWDDAIPEADRFDVFNDASRSLWHRLPVTRGTFGCDAADYLVDDIIVYRLRYDGHTITRTPAQVATGLSDGISVQLYRRGSIRGAVGEVDLYAAPDRIVLHDLAHPFSVWTEESEVIGLIVPRARIDCRDWIYVRAPVISWPADSPTGRILTSALTMLWAELPRAEMSDAPMLASSLVGLLNGLLRPSRDHEDDVRRALNVAMRQYITDHLDDLALDVDTLRRQFFCSRATLYRLFEGDGGITKYIREARLRACMHDLALPTATRKHIARIATRWGFENPSHFNRLFKQTFGVVPSAVGGLTVGPNERTRTRYHTETLNSWVAQSTPRDVA